MAVRPISSAVPTIMTHPRREMNDDIRARIAQQAANGVALHQVVVGAAGHEHVLCAVLAQFVDDEGTEEARAVLAHDADAFIFPELSASRPFAWIGPPSSLSRPN